LVERSLGFIRSGKVYILRAGNYLVFLGPFKIVDLFSYTIAFEDWVIIGLR